MPKTKNLTGKEKQVTDALNKFFDEQGGFEQFEPILWETLLLASGNEIWGVNGLDVHNRMCLHRSLVTMFKSIETISKS